jgi:beta-glucosidase
MEGEEMDVLIDGFRGGDRTRIELPDTQTRLIREVQALGKPVVLVLLNGSALAVNWENDHLAAIVEAWYPGQAAGTAIADVLFGDYNPGGRLPVTFYKSTDDLPPFEDYKISNQTYRFYKGKPLYPFGYGLSYTSFKYSNLHVTPVGRDSVRVTARLQNTGALPGDEVVQVYISAKDTGVANLRNPIHSLAAFRRISLKPGQVQDLQFTVPCSGQRDSLRMSIGGGQPDTQMPGTSNVITTAIPTL